MGATRRPAFKAFSATERSSSNGKRAGSEDDVTGESWSAIAVAIGLLGYLLYAMLRPDRF